MTFLISVVKVSVVFCDNSIAKLCSVHTDDFQYALLATEKRSSNNFISINRHAGVYE